ncbi:MAG TPA: hypothetical protein VF228_11210 [Iamia sp.]
MRIEIEIADEHAPTVRSYAKGILTNTGHADPALMALASSLVARLPAPPCGALLECFCRDLGVPGPGGLGYECKLSEGHHGDHQWHSGYRPEIVIRWPEPEADR